MTREVRSIVDSPATFFSMFEKNKESQSGEQQPRGTSQPPVYRALSSGDQWELVCVHYDIGNGAAHSGQGPPTFMNNQDGYPIDMSRGQPDLDSPSVVASPPM